ncbi:MAG: FAD-binding oxidoreductase [Nocardioides sp.]|uniref:FAD-binding oxidoreductase n=1 Tax=Nocardioides sp. TaxID=35761 RepID=UPI0039E51F39
MTPTTGVDVVGELAQRLTAIVGDRGVRADRPSRERASLDGATMSPILMDRHPLGLADLVVLPTAVDQVPEVVAAAVDLGVPVTPRGRGTGNYGQAIPLRGGLLLDLSRLTGLGPVRDGVVTAEAGAKLLTLETEAWKTGQQLWMYPSTVHSTLGGFLSGGSCGTGSIRHGDNDEGFVASLDVVDAGPAPSITHYEDEAAQPYVHAYGVAGILVRAGVRLEPLQPWRAVWASFADVHDALAIFRDIRALEPRPRLVSVDDAVLASHLPADVALVPGRASLRAVVDAETLDRVTAIVTGAGGRVESVREGLPAVLAQSTLSYNHPTWWMMRSEPGAWVHVEAIGDALIDRYDEALRVLPQATMHLEAGFAEPFVLVNGRYQGPAQVYRAMDALRALGAKVHDPHQWWVDRGVDRIRALAARNDPHGLLNPGKLRPAAESDPG